MVLLQEFGITEYTHKEIVEIMRYSSGQLSDGLHLLLLEKSPFHFHLTRNISGDDNKIRNNSITVSDG